MMMFLENVLGDARIGGLLNVLNDGTLFESGQRTAGGAAKSVKDNLQAISRRPEVTQIFGKVREQMMQDTRFVRFASPKKFGRLMISRYEPGMEYGPHFDAAFIDGVRTDLSFTLFLSDPDSYDGGELEMYTPMGQQAIKLPADCAIVYASDQLHAVRPVTQGTRLAVVGWVQSRVRSGEKRLLLFQLAEALSDLKANETPSSESLMQLKLVHNNLKRLWLD